MDDAKHQNMEAGFPKSGGRKTEVEMQNLALEQLSGPGVDTTVFFFFHPGIIGR